MTDAQILSDDQQYLQGTVERITFHSKQTGFCVIKIKIKGKADLATVIATLANINCGEYIECHGHWVNHTTHGLQFQAKQINTILPTSIMGMEKYLASGLISGVGSHFAKMLIRAFGDKTFDILDKEPKRLKKVPGIGPRRFEMIINSWKQQKMVRNIMIFLHAHGIGTRRAVHIYKTYGDRAIDIIQKNPYQLALDIRGIGFKTADEIAKQIGIDENSLIRAEAGTRHVLQTLCSEGHCAIAFDELCSKSVALLNISTDIIRQAISKEIEAKHFIADDIDGIACIYPATLYLAESKTAIHLQQLQQGAPFWGHINEKKAIHWVEQQSTLTLSKSQKKAIIEVLKNKVAVITGGPGVGKTTIIKSIIKIIQAKKCRISLCAPTGRAAKRLTESTGLQATTIHRLLVFNRETMGFKHNQDFPLHVDYLIVDEASMIDIILMYHLLKSIPKHAGLLLVGDIDQLPSVGSGLVLRDIIESDTIPVVFLKEIFRQARNSSITINAHRINNGQMPMKPKQQTTTNNTTKLNDFYTIYVDSAEEIQDKLIELIQTRIPNRFNYNAITDIQVLTPMNRGGLGCRSLNVLLQEILNPKKTIAITRFGQTFAVGDKVIQMSNNYDKEVFNGDIGFIQAIDHQENKVKISFDHRIVDYKTNEFDELNLAYAISIHKSQGSEYPVVIVPLAVQHYMLLARNLLYTAITRGQKLVILLAQKKAVGMAIYNNKAKKRLTKLSNRLQQ